MSADDQAFLDVLSAVPNDVRKYANEITDALDKHVDHLAHTLRDHIPSSWVRSPPRPPPKVTALQPLTIYDSLQIFVQKNRKMLIGVAVFLGITTYLVHKKRKSYERKRRAKRAPSGARVEIVIVAGSPNEPITKSLCLDLERRGFIVYVVCNTIEEEASVQKEGRTDIKPLMLDIADPASAKASLERFSLFFSTPQHAFRGAKPHHLILSSLIIIPSSTYPSPAAISSTTLSPSVWSDLLNTRLLYPFAIIHTFLPLLASLQPSNHQSSILVLTNSIISSLKAPFYAPESTIIGALENYTSILTKELSAPTPLPVSIPVTHIKMGNFDVSSLVPHFHQQVTSAHTPRIGRGSSTKLPSGKGSPLRELHNAVFDAMESSKASKWSLWGRSSVVRVGQGSVMYGFAGKIVPTGLIGWMMALGSRADEETEDGYVRVYG